MPGGSAKAHDQTSPAIVRSVADLREAVAGFHRDGHRVALVPTMGALHAGHMALVAAAGEGRQAVLDACFGGNGGDPLWPDYAQVRALFTGD